MESWLIVNLGLRVGHGNYLAKKCNGGTEGHVPGYDDVGMLSIGGIGGIAETVLLIHGLRNPGDLDRKQDHVNHHHDHDQDTKKRCFAVVDSPIGTNDLQERYRVGVAEGLTSP